MIIEELFCNVDDFVKEFGPIIRQHQLQHFPIQRNRPTRLSISEMMTLLIWYYQTPFRDFKSYYLSYVVPQLKPLFPELISYNRFIELIPRTFLWLTAYLTNSFSPSTPFNFIDSTAIAVCGNKRTDSHRVFKQYATLGKSSKGWFFGFKLHLICNHEGGLVNACLTPGNVSDVHPVMTLAKRLQGKLYGDKGYISKNLTQSLKKQGISLFTTLRKNMKPVIMSAFDKILLRKRTVIESINNQLKTTFRVEHTRHRSAINAFVHIIAGLIGYCKYPHKASVNIQQSSWKNAMA